MFSQVHLWDIQLFRWINSTATHPFTDWLMAWSSDFGFWLKPLFVVIVALLIFGKFRERIFLILLAFALLIGDAGIVQGIRAVVNRPRPWQALGNVRFVDRSGVEIRQPTTWKHGRSFPSGHVCNNTAAALLLTLLYPPWGWLAWLWTALIAYSRIYTGSHYPSDVLASVPISLCYTLLIWYLANWLWEKFGPRWFLLLHSRHPQLSPQKNSRQPS